MTTKTMTALVTIFGASMVDTIVQKLDAITPTSTRVTAGDVVNSVLHALNDGVADEDKTPDAHVRVCLDKCLDSYPKLYVRRGPGGGIVHTDEPRNTPAAKGGKGVAAALAALEAAGIELTPEMVNLAVKAAKDSRGKDESLIVRLAAKEGFR